MTTPSGDLLSPPSPFMSGSFDPFALVGSLAKQTGFSRIAKGQLLGGPIACFQWIVRRHGPAGSAPPGCDRHCVASVGVLFEPRHSHPRDTRSLDVAGW